MARDMAALFGALALVAGIDHQARGTIEDVAREVVEDAKARIGTYQPATSGFAAWAPLTAATQAERVQQGYSADEPLLRSGQMRDDLTYTLDDDGRGATIGIPDGAGSADYARAQEYGTLASGGSIPPRPFLRPAAAEKGADLATRLGALIRADLA